MSHSIVKAWCSSYSTSSFYTLSFETS